MANLALYDQETRRVLPYPRRDSKEVEQLDPRYVVLEVVEDPAPELKDGCMALQSETLDLTEKKLKRGWVVQPKPDWSGFKLNLVVNDSVNAALRGGFSTSPAAVLSLPLVTQGLSDMAGVSQFEAIWFTLIKQGVLGDSLLNEVSEMAERHNLPESFIRTLMGNQQPPLAEYIGQEWSDLRGELWRVVQSRGEDGKYLADDPNTADKESLKWIRVEE